MLRARSEAEREGIRRSAEFRKEKMFDDRVGRIAEPVGIDDLLERLGVNLLLRFAGPGLQFGINGELHDGGAPPPGKPPNFIPRLRDSVKSKAGTPYSGRR
jgi:hypothetical protein